MMPYPGDSWARWQVKLLVLISGTTWIGPEPPDFPAGMEEWEEGGGAGAETAGLTLSPAVWYLTCCRVEAQINCVHDDVCRFQKFGLAENVGG